MNGISTSVAHFKLINQLSFTIDKINQFLIHSNLFYTLDTLLFLINFRYFYTKEILVKLFAMDKIIFQLKPLYGFQSLPVTFK